jgi:hypothetical protein
MTATSATGWKRVNALQYLVDSVEALAAVKNAIRLCTA